MHNTILRIIFVIAVCLLMASASCSRQSPPESQKQDTQQDHGELIIVSTNDFHAALDKAEGLASVIRGLRKQYGDRMIYLDGGDQFQGSLEGGIKKGRAVVDFFNLLKPDASVLGNHEFGYGPETSSRVSVKPGDDALGNIKQRVKDATFPILSANLIQDPPASCEPGPKCNALGKQTLFEPRAVFQRTGGKVCVIGTTTSLTRNITNPAYLKGTTFQDIKAVVQAEAARFRQVEKCDWVLLLAHDGLRSEKEGNALKHTEMSALLQELPRETLDAVIGGHSHEPMQRVIQGTPVMQTGKSARYVGVLHLKKEGKPMRHKFDPWIPVPDTAVAFDVTDKLMFYRKEALEFKRQIVGSTTAPFLYEKTRETALGNMIADAILKAAGNDADCAFVNGGAVRSNLPHGKISNENVFRVMPFDNELVIADLSGKEVRALLEISTSGEIGVPLISGLRVRSINAATLPPGAHERDLNGDGKKEEWERNLVLDVRDFRGKPLDDNRTYRVATISYVVEGGDFYNYVFDKVPQTRIHYKENMEIRDILAQYFEKQSPLKPERYFVKNQPRIDIR